MAMLNTLGVRSYKKKIDVWRGKSHVVFQTNINKLKCKWNGMKKKRIINKIASMKFHNNYWYRT